LEIEGVSRVDALTTGQMALSEMCSTIKFKASNTITTECEKLKKHQALLQWHIMNKIMQVFWAAPKVMAL